MGFPISQMKKKRLFEAENERCNTVDTRRRSNDGLNQWVEIRKTSPYL